MFIPTLGAGARNQSVFERQIEAQVRRQLERDPYTVSAEVWELIRAEGGEPTDADDAVEAEAGTPAACAGIVSDRIPGLRDPITAGHPIHRQLIDGDDPVLLSGAPDGDWPSFPVGAEEIRRAALRRWRHLVAPGTELDRIYAGDATYDADHSSDELMRRAHDVDLGSFIGVLFDMEALDPALFRAAWRRDIPTVEMLVRRYDDQLPAFGGLASISDPAERIVVAIDIFWEWERGFEYLRSATGPTRRTHLTLGTALRSTTALTTAFAVNSRDGRYLADGWMQYLAMQELVEVGPGAHPASSPWVAYGPGGDPATVDHHAGLGSAAGYATLARAHCVVAPFVRHHPHRQVQQVAPASFVWGWDPLSLAIAIPLQIAATLPKRSRSKNSRQAEFVSSHYGAIGRLAMLVLGNICPDTAWAALAATAAAPRSGTSGEGPDPADAPFHGPPALGDVVANPEAWHALRQEAVSYWASPREQRSLALGPFAFDNTVRQVKASLYRVIPSDPAKPGYELGFHPPAWRCGFDPRPHLRAAAHAAPTGYMQRLPACYRKRCGSVFEFCLDLAAQIRAGYTPDAQDPAWLYGPSKTFSVGQFGACGTPGATIRSDQLAAKVKVVVKGVKAGKAPVLAPPSPATLRKRWVRKNCRKRPGKGKR